VNSVVVVEELGLKFIENLKMIPLDDPHSPKILPPEVKSTFIPILTYAKVYLLILFNSSNGGRFGVKFCREEGLQTSRTPAA